MASTTNKNVGKHHNRAKSFFTKTSCTLAPKNFHLAQGGMIYLNLILHTSSDFSNLGGAAETSVFKMGQGGSQSVTEGQLTPVWYMSENWKMVQHWKN